jgi:hypothetical protein
VVDPAQAIAWGKQAVAGDRVPWCVHVQGLSEYRAGQFDQALQRFTESKVAGWCRELNWFGLSLAHHRLGHAAEARQCLQKSIDLLRGGTQKGPPIGARATDWLEAELLRREAEELINAKSEEKPDKQ